MNFDPAWALVIITSIGLLGSLVGVLWKFSKAVDKNTIITQQILDQQNSSQYPRITISVEHGHNPKRFLVGCISNQVIVDSPEP